MKIKVKLATYLSHYQDQVNSILAPYPLPQCASQLITVWLLRATKTHCEAILVEDQIPSKKKSVVLCNLCVNHSKPKKKKKIEKIIKRITQSDSRNQR